MNNCELKYIATLTVSDQVKNTDRCMIKDTTVKRMDICVYLCTQCLCLRLLVATGGEVVRTPAETDCFCVICDTELSLNQVKPH